MADTTVTVQSILDGSLVRGRDLRKTNAKLIDTQLLICLNKAREYVHKLLVIHQSEIAMNDVDITLVAATQEYSLATNLPDFWAMAVNGVYVSDTPLAPITYEDKKREGSTTTDVAPTGYYITDTNIGVIGIPTATSAAAFTTLSCRYFKMEDPLTIGGNMPYKNVLNEPMSAFMDHMAILITDKPTAEFTALYNALEQSTLEIIKNRVPL